MLEPVGWAKFNVTNMGICVNQTTASRQISPQNLRSRQKVYLYKDPFGKLRIEDKLKRIMTRYKFYTADVFSDRIFGGNQLAVFPEARGLEPDLMQKIAKEFNLSETAFVFPPENDRHTKKLRIFTPATELPFAGHPTVGTAFVLASIGEIPLAENQTEIILEEGVGSVPVSIYSQAGKPVSTYLTAAKLPEFTDNLISSDTIAQTLSLKESDLILGEWSPTSVSCGVPFLFVPLRDRDALARARINREYWDKYLKSSSAPDIYLFCLDPEREDSDIRARMFAPSMGIEEDPATGAAASALAGYLGVRNPTQNGIVKWTVEQGFEMGRPSIIKVEAEKADKQIIKVRVGGRSIMVSEGIIEI